MKEDYKAAKKLGEKAVREAVRNGQSPYLPVLDSLEEVKSGLAQRHLGLMELPMSRIKGNKEAGRNSAFANNFMPLFEENTEFAAKWSALYDSYAKEGIRDAIKVYEYMNQYYVQEGNKRVSVSKYGKTEYILADVTRIIPEKSDSKEVIAYYEYLDFYKCTKNFLIVFSEPGEYPKLAELLGQDLEHKWPEDLCLDLKSAYFRFSKSFKTVVKDADEFLVSDAFLLYISIFPMKTLSYDSNDQITKNIKLAQDELLSSAKVEDVAFLTDAPEEADKPSGIMGMFNRTKKYTPQAPLKVGFIYDADVDNSRWIDSHEAGRLYIDEMTDDNVLTCSYYSQNEGGVDKAIDKAVADKCEIVFAVSPNMLPDILKAAVHNPDVKFLNCSVGNTYSSLRCYHGKLYEASFLMGILAADTLLKESNSSDVRRIGYIARKEGIMSVINLNAFAIGVSLIDPDCRISLKYVDSNTASEYRDEFIAEGIRMYADFDYSITGDREGMARPGVYKIGEIKDIYIGAPYFNWGKYYVKIVQSVISGTWNVSEMIDRRTAANYWFGLSTGVVDIRVPGISYQTKKMLTFFRNAIVGGDMNPFSGEIRTKDGEVFSGGNAKDPSKPDEGKILAIKWLNENIDGELPEEE